MTQKSKILIASPDVEWANKCGDHFSESGYEFCVAVDGKSTQKYMSEHDFSAVVIDFNLRDYSSIQVIKFIKVSKPATVILFVIFPETILEDFKLKLKDIIKLGVNDIIKTPKNFDAIQSSLEGFQNITQIIAQTEFKEESSPEIEIIKEGKHFSPLNIDDFYSIRYMLFDVYIKLSDNKFLKILHAGENFDLESLDRYKKKGVKELHILNKDRSRYVSFCNLLSQKISKNEKIESKQKISVTKVAVEKFLEEFDSRDFKESIIKQSKEVISSVVSLVQHDKGLAEYLRQYMEMDPSHYTHSFLVTLFSVNILQQIDWDSELARETVALGAMLHDIGKTKLPKELLKKNPSEFTDEEKELYESHPVLGAEILGECPLINPTVCQIVSNHHENRDGCGFPKGLNSTQISPICEIVALSNYYTDYIVERSFTPAIGFVHMLQNSVVDVLFDKAMVKALGQTFRKNPGDVKKSA